MATQDKREDILRAAEKAPLLSPSAQRLLQITSAREHELMEIVAVVKCDAHLTVRVLKIVNSAAFGLLYPISSIDRAVSYLGERMVVGIALNDCAAHLFDKQLDGYESERGSLWRHDLQAAIASREVAQRARVEINPDLAFTAGLLHDLGKALISDYLRGTCAGLLAEIEQNQVADYLEGERHLIGIDHTEAGSALARNWKLAEVLQMAIAHHHNPGAAPPEHRPLVYAVHLGDIIAMMGGCGTGADTLRYPLDQGYGAFFDLGGEDLAAIMLDVQEEFAKIDTSLAETKEN